MAAHILLGANHATKFPQAVKDTSGTLLQVNQVRLLKSEITGRYIMFGCNNPPSSFEPINLAKAKSFKSLRFGCKALPTLVSVITRNIGNLHPPAVNGNKEDLRKKHRGNTHNLSPSNLKEGKEKSTTSTLLSTVPKPHQPKENKIQQPTDLPETQNPQDARNQLKKDRMAIKNNKTAKRGNTLYPKPRPRQ